MRKLIFICVLFALRATAQTTPVITSMTPNTVIAGSTTLTLNIYGKNFLGGSTVQFNGANMTGVVVQSSTWVSATLTTAEMAIIQTAAITVTSSSVSNKSPLRILSPLATVTSYSPTVLSTAVDTPITVYGQDFQNNATVLFDWVGLTTTFVGNAELKATVPHGLVTGNDHVYVYNGPYTGGGGSNFTPSAQITPGSLSFGSVTKGTQATLSVQVIGVGGVTILNSPSFITFTGTNAADFTYLGLGSCAPGYVLPVNGACSLSIAFTPSTTSSETATANVATSAGTYTISLSGTGTAPVTPTACGTTYLSIGQTSFGGVTLSTQAAITSGQVLCQDFTMTLGNPWVTWSGSGDFSIISSTCANGLLLQQNSPCTFVVSFMPSTAAYEAANMTVFSNSSDSPESLSFNGTGINTTAFNVIITWLASASPNLAGYNVYRGTKTGGPYSKIASVVPGTSYTDVSVNHGTTYFYVVTSVGLSSFYSVPESGNSNEVSATP